eukprot:2042771-Amphidinium_carterae.1
MMDSHYLSNLRGRGSESERQKRDADTATREQNRTLGCQRDNHHAFDGLTSGHWSPGGNNRIHEPLLLLRKSLGSHCQYRFTPGNTPTNSLM